MFLKISAFACTIILFCCAFTTAHKTHRIHHTIKRNHSVDVAVMHTSTLLSLAPNSSIQSKLSNFIYIVNPKKGKQYANLVATSIVSAAKKNHISPIMVASTAYVESEFSMHASGGIGIMQISPSTYSDNGYRRQGLHARNISDNIYIGADELSRHYNEYPSRGGYDRMEYAWARYNGSSTRSNYVQKSLTVYRHLSKDDAQTLENHLRSCGPLWRRE